MFDLIILLYTFQFLLDSHTHVLCQHTVKVVYALAETATSCRIKVTEVFKDSLLVLKRSFS